MVVPLPIGEPDHVRRLQLIAAETAARKSKAHPPMGSGIFRFAVAQRMFLRLFARQRLMNVKASGAPTARPTSPRWASTTSATTSSRSCSAATTPSPSSHVATDGTTTVLKQSLPVLEGEVVDATVLRVAALDAFLRNQIARAKADDVLFSVHLKATMMKVSDPIIFGHVVKAFLPEVFETYGADLAAAGLSPNNGLGGILDGLSRPAQR